MNWYKESQFTFAYHGTSQELLPEIKKRGLIPISGKIFFAMNENEISPYVDDLWLRFPVPFSYEKHIGRGNYYSTQDSIPPDVIEFKTSQYEDYRPVVDGIENQEKIAQKNYFDIMDNSNILWFIDTNYRLHTISENELEKRMKKREKNEYDFLDVTHGNWDEYNNSTVVANGRYSPSKNHAFIIMNPQRQGFHYYNFLENKVLNIISKSFNNPKTEVYW